MKTCWFVLSTTMSPKLVRLIGVEIELAHAGAPCSSATATIAPMAQQTNLIRTCHPPGSEGLAGHRDAVDPGFQLAGD